MKERIQIKHDIAANWAKAKNFTPLPGEIIIYDGIIENGLYIEQPRLKIGDGIHKLAELPFLSTESSSTTQKYQYDIENEILELK
jgi:hypothetical protein